MNRAVVIIGALIVGAGIAALAIEWKEVKVIGEPVSSPPGNRLFCGHNDMPRLVDGKWICWSADTAQKWWENQPK